MVCLRFGAGLSVAVFVLFTLGLSHGDKSTQVVRRPIPAPAPPGSSSGKIAFSVRKAQSFSLNANNRVFFQDVITNQGGAYRQQNGEFLAPTRGGYFFTFHAVAAQNGDFTLALMKNGQYQVTAYGTNGQYNSGSNSVFLELNPYDRIHLQLQDGRIYEHPFSEAYTTFSGFMVYSL